MTFCKPDVLKPDVSDVLKPDVLKPDVWKPDVLWVYTNARLQKNYTTVDEEFTRKITNIGINSFLYHKVTESMPINCH
jgi:hypothetical protein